MWEMPRSCVCAVTKGVKEPSEKCVSCGLVFHQTCFNHKKEAILCTKCSNSIISKSRKHIDFWNLNSNINTIDLGNITDGLIKLKFLLFEIFF